MIIVAQKMGRLGNLLEQFSHLIAFSRDHDIPVASPAFWDCAPYFERTRNNLWCRYPCQGASLVSATPARIALFYSLRILAKARLLGALPSAAVVPMHWEDEFDLSSPEFVDTAKRHRIVFLIGGWKHRYWAGYEKHLDSIRREFALAEPYAGNVRMLMREVRNEADVVFGVHIRQTDIQFDPVRKDYFKTSQYVDVMKRAQGLFPGRRVSFLICSDEKQDLTQFAPLKCFRGTGHFVEDMYSLGECDYIMGAAQSSFSAWGSLMGQKPRYGLTDPGFPFTLDDFKVCRGLR